MRATGSSSSPEGRTGNANSANMTDLGSHLAPRPALLPRARCPRLHPACAL
jgi:hypothetical protein